MPVYTYRCNNCNHQFEQRQKMTDPPLTVCPVCDGGVRRLVNSVGVLFKGSGFYITDNRNGNSAATASSTVSTSSSKEEKSSSAGDKTTAKETATTSTPAVSGAT